MLRGSTSDLWIKRISDVAVHGMTIEGLDKGVVTVVIRTGSGSFSKKIVLK